MFLPQINLKEVGRRLGEVMDMVIALTVFRYTLNPKLIDSYTLNKYSLLHINHTSIKWLFNKKTQVWNKVASLSPPRLLN